jgi:hypothetical protein
VVVVDVADHHEVEHERVVGAEVPALLEVAAQLLQPRPQRVAVDAARAPTTSALRGLAALP